MWYSSEVPSNNIPHQAPSLNHSLLWVFEAVGPCVHLTSGLKERGTPKATPVSRTITPTAIIICIQNLRLRSIPEFLAFPLDDLFWSECRKISMLAGNCNGIVQVTA